MARTKAYPGTLEKRGDAFRVILYADGRRQTFTIHPQGRTARERRKAAEKYAREKHDELTRLAAAGLPGQLTFSQLVAEFKKKELPKKNAAGTRRAYGRILGHLNAFFKARKDPTLDVIRGRDIEDYLEARRREGLSDYTLAAERRVAHLLFHWAIRREYVEHNPVANTEPPKPDPRDPVILDDGQYGALLAKLEGRPMATLYTVLLAETGMRAESEALWLQWADVDLQQGFIKVASGRDGHRTKSGKARWIPMTPRLREAMREHFARFRFATYDGKRTVWVLHHTMSRRNYGAGERIASLRGTILAAAKEAKIPEGFRLHDLRHRRATVWLAEGRNPVHVKEALGHASLQTTMAYTHLAKEHLRALVEEPTGEDMRDLGT